MTSNLNLRLHAVGESLSLEVDAGVGATQRLGKTHSLQHTDQPPRSRPVRSSLPGERVDENMSYQDENLCSASSERKPVCAGTGPALPVNSFRRKAVCHAALFRTEIWGEVVILMKSWPCHGPVALTSSTAI